MLTDQYTNLQSNIECFDKLTKEGMISDFDEYFKTVTGDDDTYYVLGNTLDMFMSSHPSFSETWKDLASHEKWIFAEIINSFTAPILVKTECYFPGTEMERVGKCGGSSFPTLPQKEMRNE